MFKRVFKKSLYIAFVMSAPIAHATPDLTDWKLVDGHDTILFICRPNI